MIRLQQGPFLKNLNSKRPECTGQTWHVRDLPDNSYTILTKELLMTNEQNEPTYVDNMYFQERIRAWSGMAAG